MDYVFYFNTGESIHVTAAMNSHQLVFLLVVLAKRVFTYHQSDYILTTERAVMSSSSNQNMVASVNFFKFNRTYTALNFTITAKRDFGNNVKVNVQAYKFQSNEYRQFPMFVSTNGCLTLAKNEFGSQNLYSCGNFTGCPVNKGTYHICNWGPDYSHFPPHIPVGQYKLTLEFKHFSEELVTLDWYVKIVSTKVY